MKDIKKPCIEVFAQVMNVPDSEINEQTNPESLIQWDSLTHVQLISQLEDKFSIEISPDEGIGLESFKMVVEYVTRKME